MRFREIVCLPPVDLDFETTITEEIPSGGIAPLTPAQSRAKAKQMAKAAQAVQDVKSANAVRVQKATHKLFQS